MKKISNFFLFFADNFEKLLLTQRFERFLQNLTLYTSTHIASGCSLGNSERQQEIVNNSLIHFSKLSTKNQKKLLIFPINFYIFSLFLLTYPFQYYKFFSSNTKLHTLHFNANRKFLSYFNDKIKIF